jgi:hypothetical protein
LWSKTANSNEQGKPKAMMPVKTSANWVDWAKLDSEAKLFASGTIECWDWECWSDVGAAIADAAIRPLDSIMPNQTGVRCFMIVVRMLDEKSDV